MSRMCHNVKVPSLTYYLPITGERIGGCIPFPWVLVVWEVQKVTSRVRTRVTMTISYDDNPNTSSASLSLSLSLFLSLSIYIYIYALVCKWRRIGSNSKKQMHTHKIFDYPNIYIYIYMRVWGVLIHVILNHLEKYFLFFYCVGYHHLINGPIREILKCHVIKGLINYLNFGISSLS